MTNTALAPSATEQILLAADQYNRYPGELVTLHLRFIASQDENATLQLAMPRVARAESYILPEGVPPNLPTVAEHDQDVIILIPLKGYFEPGQQYDLQIGVRLNTFYVDQYLLVAARLITADAETLASASLRLTVFGKGKYLKYLPELYEKDDFTGRFLMLFESFWKPISQQIEQGEHFYDPDLTPPEFIPWLASWIGLPVDDSLPVERMRILIRKAMMLFQRRGTKQALQTYLEIYTNGTVSITERRASNFVLGADASLGMEIALGTKNRPNSVLVRLRVPKSELERTKYSPETYRKKIASLVQASIPAHVSYDIDCTFEAAEV